MVIIMKYKYILGVAVKNIWRNKNIVILQILCLTLGFIIPFFFLGQLNEAVQSAKENKNYSVTDHIIKAEPDYSDYTTSPIEDFSIWKKNEMVKEIHFLNRLNAATLYINNKLNPDYSIYGTDSKINQIWKENTIKKGEFWSSSYECIIGENVAIQSKLSLNDTLQINEREYIVKGILQIPQYNNTILIPFDSLKDTSLFDVVYYLSIDPKADCGRIKKEIEELVVPYGSYEISSESEINQEEQNRLTKGWEVTIIISIISFFYGAVNVYNIMFFYTLKSQKKLAVSMAVGANQTNLYLQKFLEIGINMVISAILVFISLFFVQRSPIQSIVTIRVDNKIFIAIFLFTQIEALIYTWLLLHKFLKRPLAESLKGEIL